MKNRIFLILLSAILVLSLCACANTGNDKMTTAATTTGDPADTTSAADTTDANETTGEPASNLNGDKYDDGTISFTLPEGWTVADESVYIIIMPSDPELAATNINFISQNSTMPEIASITEQELGSALSAVLNNFETNGLTTVDTDGGLSGVCLKYTFVIESVTINGMQYYLNSADKSAIITYTYLPEQADESMIESIINSVKLS